MKTGKTLLDLANEIERQKKAKLDLVAPTAAVAMTVIARPLTPVEPGHSELAPSNALVPKLVVGTNGDARTFGVRRHAHHQLAAGLEIPRAYYDRMLETQPNLLAENVNTWLRSEPATRLVRTLDGDVRAWLSDRYRPLDNEQLIEFLGPVFAKYHGDLVVETSEITERKLYIKVSYPKVEAAIAPGDVVRSGFVVTNSEVGAGALSVYPWVLRLICTNGMKVERAGQRRYHVGRKQESFGGEVVEYRADTQRANDRAVMLRFRDTVEACLRQESFESIVTEFRTAATSTPIENPAPAVEVLAKRIGLSEAESNSVLRHLTLGGDLSAWGAANAVTRTAEDVEDFDRASEIERLGYEVIEMTQNGGTWEQIAKAA